jgi:hypothetical protein
MKTKSILSVMFSMILAFGILFIGCDTGNGTPNEGNVKSLKITGITLTGSVTVIITETLGSSPSIAAGGTATITNGEVTIPLKNISGEIYTTEWTGSGEYYIMFWNTAAPSGGPTLVGALNNNQLEKIDFSGIVTTVPFSQLGMTNSNADPNPILGNWTASIPIQLLLECEESTWILTFNDNQNIQMRGTYSPPVNGSSPFAITDVKNTTTGAWVNQIPNPLPDPNIYGVYGIDHLPGAFNGSVSENQLTITGMSIEAVVLTK